MQTRSIIVCAFGEADEYTPGILVTRFAPLLHNRLSQQLGQLSTPPGARPSSPVFFRLLTVTPLPSPYPSPDPLVSSFSFSFRLSFSLSLSILRYFPQTISRHVSFHDSRSACSLASSCLFLILLDLPFCHF